MECWENFVKIIVNFKSVLYLYQDEFIGTIYSESYTLKPESPAKIDAEDVDQSGNARSDEILKNEEFDSEDENQNFDSVELENHSEIRKYLDLKYPDDPNQPKKKLIIISAMFRSGSSFMGSLFGMGLKPNRKQFSIGAKRTGDEVRIRLKFNGSFIEC